MKYWDKAWSLVSQCTQISPACDFCWLKAIDTRFGKAWDGNIQTHPERLELPLKTKKPTTWAVWSDLFHEKVPFSFIHDVFLSIASRPEHKFLICTKRPERMNQFINDCIHPDRYSLFGHVFLGTTVENQEMADKRIPELLKCSPFNLFLSVEPLLSAVDIPPIMLSRISYIISGCESGHHARHTELKWIETLKGRCREAGTPMWVKQIKINGKMVYDYQELSTIKREELWK